MCSTEMICFLTVIIYLCAVTAQSNQASDYYYWKEYTGVVPQDALPGGKDPDGRTTYIGQGYVHEQGIFVGSIYPGVKEISVPWYGDHIAKKDIKILCTTTPEIFRWVKTSNDTFTEDAQNLDFVIGGYDVSGNAGFMSIGRIYDQGYVLVGNIWKDHKLWYVLGPAVRFYEVLTVEMWNIAPRANVYGNYTIIRSV